MFLFFAVMFGLGYWLGTAPKNNRDNESQNALLQRIINALVFSAQNEIKKTKDKSIKEALNKVIEAGYREQYGQSVKNSVVVQEDLVTQDSEQVVVKQAILKQDLDNTSLLLYLGAFLFITSIGLFVSFASLGGVIRTFLVAIVAALMYLFGYWLYRTKSKLEEVGVTFIGIGMSAIPFVGVAAYYYVFDQSFGPAIWLAISVISLVVYVSTILKIRNTFIAYMLVASIVSLMEASVSIVNGPVYYYLWMMILAGIVLQLISLFSHHLPQFKDSSANSSILLVPLTMMTSLFIIGNEGYWQLAGSLMLGAAYYGMQYFIVDKQKELYSLGFHALLLAGLAVGVYAINESITDAAGMLMAGTAIQIILVSTIDTKLKLVFARFQDVAMAAAFISILLSLLSPAHLTLAFISAIILGITVTIRSNRQDSFTLTIIYWVIFSVIIGQVYPSDAISNFTQTFLTFSFSIPLLVMAYFKQVSDTQKGLTDSLQLGIIGLHLGAMGFAISAGGYNVLVVTILSIVSVLVLAKTGSKRWVNLAVFYSLVPIVYVLIATLGNYLHGLPVFTVSTIIVLIINVLISLYYKNEAARFVSTGSWLLLPIALGIEKIGGFNLDPDLLMWIYLAVAVVLSISRAIARGRIMTSSNTVIESLTKESSEAYEIGLAIAASAAVILSFASTANQGLSTLVIMLAGLIVTIGGTIIEREASYLAVMPFIIQIALLRLLEPYVRDYRLSGNDYLVDTYVIVSSALAVGIYIASTMLEKSKEVVKYIKALTDSAAVTTIIAPLSVVFISTTVWSMPVSLIVASIVLIHIRRNGSQDDSEKLGFITLAGIYWWMFYLEIYNIQAYTHVLAILFAIYAYLRHLQKDSTKEDKYLSYMLGVATIPLALQALGNTSGAGAYGIWLLLESVGFLLLGINIRKKVVIRWGLYVALGSVLYQLRGLGWAMVSVLALFLIGIAVYRSLKQADEK